MVMVVAMSDWIEIDGYRCRYMVNSVGNVLSHVRKEPKILSPAKTRLGYLMVSLGIDGKYKWHTIHRLVANAFIENPENKPCVNHIDFNPLNNSIDNLEWCTYKENATHSYNANRLHKLVDEVSIVRIDKYNNRVIYRSIMSAVRDIDGNCGNIWAVLNDRKNTSCGYKWEYLKKSGKDTYIIKGDEKL